MELKDISYPLRVAYIEKLIPVQYGGVPVPAYDSFVPGDAPNYFIVIKDQNEADKSLKCGFNTDVHVTVDIVTRFPPGTGTSVIADNISGQVNAIICSNTNRIDLRPAFSVMNSIRTLSRPIKEESKEKNILRRVNIYKHEIQQLT